MDQLDLTDIYRTFHPKTMNFTFFSSANGTFSRIDHILDHKSNLDKFKKIEIIPSIFSDHNALRLDLNYRRKIMFIAAIEFFAKMKLVKEQQNSAQQTGDLFSTVTDNSEKYDLENVITLLNEIKNAL